ncbi:hypothetical protein GCM10011369_21710 [Neiella marina]|uniref:FlgO domain-containing protein n=1 Tax=Neiella marina TaxID=508461 RepID=A0A8J2U5L8_9GAMM|nr:FlgO family outer membrane protein [Neiella marina]GGA79422.1 hypothetical protein GCM10011369_21710 [Neiella marina]
MNKRLLTGLLAIWGLVGCASQPLPEHDPIIVYSDQEPTQLVGAIDDMARQLFATRKFVTLETPIAVTSFVELKSLQKTSELGNQMAESFVHHLQANGYRVIEYKAPGYIKVTEQGDYALSRDYQDLTGSFEIDYILTGTYSSVPQGMMVNVRMFAAESKIVVATAQGFIPNQALAKEPIKNTDHQALRMEHGSLVRSEPALTVPTTEQRSDDDEEGDWL